MHFSKRTYYILFFLIYSLTASSQDVSFSQFYSNNLYLNPAYVGNPKHQRAQIAFRNQWLTTKSPYMSYGVSYDRFFMEQNSGIGINIINDVQGNGAINKLSTDILYSYTFQVSNRAQIRGGIQIGGIYRSQNTKDLIFSDMISPIGEIVGTPGFAGESKFTPDVAAGVVGEWDMFFGGFAIHHISQPIEYEDRERTITIPRKYTVNLGAEINLNRRYLFRKSFILSPNIIYQQQLNFKQINFGLYLAHEHLVTGIWLRENIGFNSHTFIFVAGYHDLNFSIAYSYDFSVMQGGFRGLNTSSHEVTFAWYFQYKTTSRKKINAIKSPKF